MTNNLKPAEQDTLPSTPWIKGNTGRTKRKNYNQDFELLFRTVSLGDKRNCPPKKQPGTPCLCGGQENNMGGPNPGCDSDPNLSVKPNANSKLMTFSTLPSILAARKERPQLNIAYDCEYQSVSPKERIILSYQFALYIDDSTVLEICFLSKRYDMSNRLYLRTCLGAILDLLQRYGHRFENYEYAKTRVYPDTKNPSVYIDKNKPYYNDYRAFQRISMGVTIVCHAGIVDLSAFKDDIYGFSKKEGHIMPYLKSVQGGMVSIEPYFVHVPSASEYWKFYPIKILVRDTMCYAPAEGKSLAILGDSVNIPKVKLEDGVISNMQSYLSNHKEDFLAYAAQDALVTITYGSTLWGINKEWCLTSTAGSASAIRDSIATYMRIARNLDGSIDNDDFNAKYKGVKKVKKGKISTPVGLRQVSAEESISPEANWIHMFSANSYAGGYNTCSIPGVFQGFHTFDYDLENAYPTAMCLIMDIDWSDPIERFIHNEDLSLQAFHTPVDPIFCLIDFEFPEDCIYPCIAIHNDGSIVFSRKGTSVYASGPSMYLALKLGAKIHVRYGYVARILANENGTSMSLRVACKQMVCDRAIAQKIYKKGSVQEKLLKLFVNGGYGKIAQNVIEKHTWDGWREVMDDIGCSSITSPERATLITDIVRCMLIGTMNQLAKDGIRTFSVTTDGFITESALDKLNSCDCYGFRDLFEQSRIWLTGDPTIWAVKHDQYDLINPTTRCNVGFGGDKGVLAHGGYKTGFIKDSIYDYHSMAETILHRTSRVEYTTTEFVNQKEMVMTGCDFYTYEQTRHIRLDYDMKRKPIRESMYNVTGTVNGIDYKYVNFDTIPFETIEEYEQYRTVNQRFDCIRTMEDWNLFYLRLQDDIKGLRHNTSDIEWSKLMSVIQGYRMCLWDIPDLTACDILTDKLAIINQHNHSKRLFKETHWKNCRKPERASQILPEELLSDILDEFGAVKINR